MRSRLRKVLLALIGLLYVISVPWYRETGGEVGTVLGLPSWVAVALGCYIAVAVLNSAAWLLTEMPSAEEEARDSAGSPGQGAG